MLWEMVIDGMEVPEDTPARDHVAELLGRIAARDDRAFAQLYDALSPRVFRSHPAVSSTVLRAKRCCKRSFSRSGNPPPRSLQTEKGRGGRRS